LLRGIGAKALIQKGPFLACNLLGWVGRVVARVTGPFMPIQSVFTNQASAEAPAARSRAGQAEPQEAGEIFVLPEAEATVAGTVKAAAAAKVAATAEPAATNETGGADQIVDPATVSARLDGLQPTAVPAAPAPAGKPAPQAAKADASGIAFLIAMAAAQAGARTEAAGEEPAAEPGEVAGEVREGATKKDGKAAVEDKGEIAAAAAAPVAESPAAATPAVVVSAPALLQLGPSIAIDAAADDAAEAVSSEGATTTGAAKPALAAATAGLPLIAAAAPEQPQAGIAAAAEGKAAAGGVQALGTVGQGAQEFADVLAKADQPAAAKGVQAPAQDKALDALQQQPAAPFDLSTLLQQAPGKSGHDRLLQPFDPSAAPGAAPGAPGQSAANGQPTPIHVVPIEIGLRAMSGSRQFDIRLDPDELGRVDVNLSISDAGEVSARLVVDRVETLHLLQRDARTLERAFEQAGLKPSDGGVDITLRDPSDQSAFRQNRQQDEAPQRPRQPNGSELAEDVPLSIDPAPQRRLIRLGGVDLSI
jgi:flagellar hook-length control protein FliK